MRSITRSLAILLVSIAALGQQIDLNTQVKGSRLPSFGTDSGSANAYAITTIAPIGSGGVLQTGSCFRFIAAHSSTGASTIAIDGGSAISIKQADGTTAIGNGDIAGLTEVCYDGTNFRLEGMGFVTINTNTPLSGGGRLNLGGSLTLSCSGCSGGGGSTTLCKSTGLTDTLTTAGTFATTCTISANTTVFGTQIDVYAVGTEHIVSGDNHQYGLASGESGGQISQIGHSALTGDYVWAAHWGFTILYDDSHSSLQNTGFAMTTGQCFLYEQNGGGSKFFSCTSVGLPFTPNVSHSMQINVGNFATGSNSVLTSFWVTQTDP